MAPGPRVAPSALWQNRESEDCISILRLLLIIASVAGTSLALLMGYGAIRWEANTQRLRARLESCRQPMRCKRVDFRELEGLPHPVQRYLRLALQDGQPVVTRVWVRHRGTFNMGEVQDTWKPFLSEQCVVTRRSGFLWNGRVFVAPGLSVRVHDAYVAGEGILFAALLGLFPVARQRGTPTVAEGELMRFFAEAAWYPSALLPSQGVAWAAADERSAYATLSDGAVRITMLFRFSEEGFIETVRAEARGRTVGHQTVPTPWQGRFWNYHDHAGMRVPLDGEVAWLLPEGAKPYWRGHIVAIDYEFAG